MASRLAPYIPRASTSARPPPSWLGLPQEPATPEGHSVHRLANAFTAHFTGQVVQASSPQGRFTEGAATLDGLRLTSAEAQGKQMFLGFDADQVWLRVHLGLYGGWRFHGPGLAGLGRRTRAAGDDDAVPDPRGAVRLRLQAGPRVADLSGPTACALLSPDGKRAALAKLGEDPLRPDADPARAWARLHASRSAVGLLLMRQDILAGIGNIYRAELLFRAGLDPHTPGRALDRAAWDAMWADLVALMADGVKTGRIVTTRPADRPRRKTAAVKRGDASYVAHRAGKPCRVCATPVQAEPMAGRTLYWCPTCQPPLAGQPQADPPLASDAAAVG